MRKKKKKHEKQEYFNEYEMELWRRYILQITKPVIPYDVPVYEYPYTCIKDGPADPKRYPDLHYIWGETYYVRRCRQTHANVEVRGPFYKKKGDYVHIFKTHFVVDKEHCQKYLKRSKDV